MAFWFVLIPILLGLALLAAYVDSNIKESDTPDHELPPGEGFGPRDTYHEDIQAEIERQGEEFWPTTAYKQSLSEEKEESPPNGESMNQSPEAKAIDLDNPTPEVQRILDEIKDVRERVYEEIEKPVSQKIAEIGNIPDSDHPIQESGSSPSIPTETLDDIIIDGNIPPPPISYIDEDGNLIILDYPEREPEKEKEPGEEPVGRDPKFIGDDWKLVPIGNDNYNCEQSGHWAIDWNDDGKPDCQTYEMHGQILINDPVPYQRMTGSQFQGETFEWTWIDNNHNNVIDEGDTLKHGTVNAYLPVETWPEGFRHTNGNLIYSKAWSYEADDWVWETKMRYWP